MENRQYLPTLYKKLTVKYQDLTPSGVPRFPVRLRVRQEE
jgi:hypothetical protein